jgi:hypothetical protein
MKKMSLSVAGVIFLLIAGMQFARYHLGMIVVVGNGHHIPLWMSLWAAVGFGLLGVWMLGMAMCNKCCCQGNTACQDRKIQQ